MFSYDTQKFLVNPAGNATGGTIAILSTCSIPAIQAASFTALGTLVASGLIGLIPLSIVAGAEAAILDALLEENNPKTNLACKFALAASTTVLGAFIGMVTLGAFVALIANPYTLPMLVATGISAGIILGLTAFIFDNYRKNIVEYSSTGGFDVDYALPKINYDRLCFWKSSPKAGNNDSAPLFADDNACTATV